MTVGAVLTLAAVALGVGAVVFGRRGLHYGSAAALTLATGWLFVQFATEDWGNVYVVSTTRPGLSPLVRLAGLWGGAEGSLLLFTALVAIAGAITARLAGEFRPLSALAAAYGIVVLVAANPFERFDAPATGGIGLQPVLEHPAMVWHPPILYLGLIGVMVPGLLMVGAANPRTIRVGWEISIALLTAGLATGAAWAHAELGWGGFWAWDPIESAGLIAWLAAVAAQHLRPSAKDRRTIVAVLLPALAAVWATTLTRAGLTGSVHSFADRPGLRAALLVVAFGWTGVVGWVAFGSSRSVDSVPVMPGRRNAAVLLLIATVIVALGTYEPAVEMAVGGDSVGIAGSFFARAMWPLVLVGAGLAVASDRTRVAPVVGGLVALILTPLSAGPFGLAIAAAGGAMVGSALESGRSRRRGWLAHVGVGVLLVGIAGTIAATSASVILIKDRPTEVAGQTVIHRGLELEQGSNTETVIGTIEVDGDLLRPSIVAHRLRNVPTAEIATHRSLLNQTQVVLSDGSDGQADYRISQTPRLNLVWFGAVLVALGLLHNALTAPARRQPGSSLERNRSTPTGDLSDT